MINPIQTYKQTNKQTNKHKQTNIQTNKSKHTNKQTNQHTNKQTYKQTNIQTNKKQTKPIISIIFKINTEDLQLNHLVTCSMFSVHYWFWRKIHWRIGNEWIYWTRAFISLNVSTVWLSLFDRSRQNYNVQATTWKKGKRPMVFIRWIMDQMIRKINIWKHCNVSDLYQVYLYMPFYWRNHHL